MLGLNIFMYLYVIWCVDNVEFMCIESSYHNKLERWLNILNHDLYAKAILYHAYGNLQPGDVFEFSCVHMAN